MTQTREWGLADGQSDAIANRAPKACNLSARGDQYVYDCAYLEAYWREIARQNDVE